MPCHAAITDQSLTFPLDKNVEEAVNELKAKNIDTAAVVNETGTIEGIFSLPVLMKNLLPVSVVMSDGIQLDITVRAAPGIAKRLRKVYPLTVAELMDRKFAIVYPDTPIWEGVNHLVNVDACLAVVDGQNNKFLGFMTSQSAMAELQRLLESES